MDQTMQHELSRRERQIMDVIYRFGDATAAEVLDNIPDPPSYSAVRALLRILEDKGHIKHDRVGPRYVYKPVVPADEARESALKHVVATFFSGSVSKAVAALLEDADLDLSDADLKKLQKRIDQAKKEGR